MGQHYHVFFHKRRYSYGSPVCGFFSLLIYLGLLFYMVVKFKAVFDKSEYVTVEQFKPINLEENNISMYDFFESIKLNFAVFRIDVNFNVISNCNQFIDESYFTIDVKNPNIFVNVKVNYTLSDDDMYRCHFDLDYGTDL